MTQLYIKAKRPRAICLISSFCGRNAHVSKTMTVIRPSTSHMVSLDAKDFSVKKAWKARVVAVMSVISRGMRTTGPPTTVLKYIKMNDCSIRASVSKMKAN